MLDIKFVRENPEIVRENIRKKFQDSKLPLVDEVIELDAKIRELKLEGDKLRSERNASSQKIGQLMREKRVDEANEIKVRTVEINKLLDVAFEIMLAISDISTINVLWSEIKLSLAPILVNILSTTGIFADLAGTKEPICAIIVIKATCRI